MQDDTNRISTGCEPLDRLLKGGFGGGEVSLVYGEAATGKTTLSMQTAVEAIRRKHRVLYLDADQSFTYQRFTQIAYTDWEELSSRLILFLPDSFSDQSHLIEALATFISPKVRLIVVDTITSLYRAALGTSDKIFALNRELNRQLAYLSELALRYSLAVIVTGQVHSTPGDGRSLIEPVARRTLFHWPSAILHLKPTARPNIKEAILERYRKSELGSLRCLVGLTDKGMESLDLGEAGGYDAPIPK